MREVESNANTAKAPATELSYMRQLDGLRAIAVLSVLYYHFYSNTLPFGIMGVRLFFVLSGFLITGILLQCRRLAEAGGQSSLFTLGRFYLRRFLRIFPLFYLVLIVCAGINLQGFRDGFWWHATYLSNFYFAAGGNAGSTIHFWSLAVEEQFYLLWPWLILYVPRLWLPPMIKLFIASALIYRLICLLLDTSYTTLYVLPFGSFDSLGIGALIALMSDKQFELSRSKEALRRIGSRLGVPLLFATLLLHVLHRGYKIEMLLQGLAISLVSAWLVIGAAEGFAGRFGKLLGWAPLKYLGAISYGIYIYHLPVQASLHRMSPQMSPAVDALVSTALTICVAALSWHVFESPINNLKRHFGYRASGAGAKVATAPARSTISASQN